MSSLRKRVKDAELNAKKRRQDFDPEDDALSKQQASDDDSGSEGSADEHTGREHYVAVNKSKLRGSEKTKLDEKKYGGQAVSRDKIFQDDDTADALAPDEDEDNDPFALGKASASEDEESEDLEVVAGSGEEIGSDDEIDSDDAFEVGEEDGFRSRGFVFRGSGQDLAKLPDGEDDSEEDEDEESDGPDNVSDGEDEDDSDLIENGIGDSDDASQDEETEDESEDEDPAKPQSSASRSYGNANREALKALISSDTAALASSLSATLSADARKGTAVKKQYQTFDRLLDARIKLQKGLTTSNNLELDTNISDTNAQTALQRAQEAALNLYATIESLRHTILDAQSSSTTPPTKKRKRPTTSTSSTELWSRLTALESQAVPHRNTILDKWSNKTRPTAPLPSTSKLSNNTSTQQADSKLSTVISAYLTSETPKLLSSSQPSPSSYDDSAFYQSLLRDLINLRASSNPNGGTQVNVPVVPMKLHPSGNVSKGRKVDTKASKGRKIRYTVHEKLENFMASEGMGNVVGQWNDGAVREFFGSLLGQSGLLGEGEDEDVDMNGDAEDEDKEVEALRLFRT